MSQNHKKYRPDIDGLRTVAVLSVVIFHAFPHGRLRGGFTGVDIFFVISGYLITLILLSEMASGKYSTIAFYRRRIQRIFPALITVLLACLAVGWLALLPDEFSQLGKHIVGSGAFIVNFMLWNEIGYFDAAADLKPLLHLWSLGIEEQFYIVWPLLMLVIYKLNGSFLRWSALIAALSFGYSIYCLFFDQQSAFYNPAARMWELACGSILAALVSQGYAPRSQRESDIISIFGAVLVIVSFLIVRQSGSFPGFKALLPVTGGCLLIFAGPNGLLNRTVLSTKIFVAIGLISYPLYLWHWPILAFLRIGEFDGTFRDVPAHIRVVAVLASIVLAWLTYQFIEKPLRFGPIRVIAVKPLAFAMIAIVAFGATVYSAKGIPSRMDFDPPTALVLFGDYPHQSSNTYCHKNYPEMRGSWACLLSKDRPADVAILGDSHANQYHASLAKFLPNSSVLNISEPGCMPFSSREDCAAKVNKILAELKASETIRTVIFAGYFSVLEAGLKYENIEGRRVAAEPTAASTQRFVDAGSNAIQQMTESGKQVVVIKDIPDLIFRPRDCVGFSNPVMAFLRGSVDPRPLQECGIDRNEFLSRNMPYDQTLETLLRKYPDVVAFETRPYFCNERRCMAFADGEFDYWNSDHLTLRGADKVIKNLVEKVDLPL